MQMIPTRTIQTALGPFLIPAAPGVTEASEECARNVLSGREYSYPRYPRDRVEDVRTLVDVGANLGQFVVWAKSWWPGLGAERDSVWCYEPHEAAWRVQQENVGALLLSGLLSRYAYRLETAAVTTNPTPLLATEPGRPENWGGMRTHNATEGTPVPAIHPRDLPPADVLKIDCEGCEGEVIEHYQHLGGVKVLLMEVHESLSEEERHVMYKRIENAGLVLRRGNPSDPPGDVRVWVRP